MIEFVTSTKQSEKIANEFRNFFYDRKDKGLQIDGLKKNDSKQKEIINDLLSDIIPNYRRKLIVVDSYLDQIKITIRKDDPLEYKRHVSELQQTTDEQKRKTLIRGLVYSFISDDTEVINGNVRNKIKELNETGCLDTYQIIVKNIEHMDIQKCDDSLGKHDWYLAKVSLMTIIKDFKNMILDKKTLYNDAIYDLDEIKRSMKIEDTFLKISNRNFFKLISVNDNLDSVFSMPVLYQNERLGISGRMAPLNMYHVISDFIFDRRWIIFSDDMLVKDGYNIDPDRIKEKLDDIMKVFLHSFFKAHDIDTLKIPQIRRYDRDESFIVDLSFGMTNYAFEVILTEKQKEFLLNGGDLDELR